MLSDAPNAAFGQDQRPSFVIRERLDDLQSDKTTYYFSIGEDGKPIKLGDGTFGVVYQVVDATGEPFAVKLLYDNPDHKHDQHILLVDKSIISEFRNRGKLSEDHALIQRLDTFSQELEHKQLSSVNELVLELSKLTWRSEETANTEQRLTHEQLAWLLEQMLVPRSRAVERFMFEMNAKRVIRESLPPGNARHRLSGIVNIIGGTTTFQDEPAYAKLKNLFRNQSTKVSSYALVMDKYDCTLKDLLERSYDYEKALFTSGDTPVGYKRLERLSFNQRIQHIMPYMLGVAAALEILHETDSLCHYDIKPANIYVNNDKTGLNAVLGDLGFFSKPEITESTFFNLHDILPLGTRHYRSPEQKDFFDACEADVSHEGNQVVLNISDPKFKHTIIEQGDGVIFNKDTNRTVYTIEEKGSIENGHHRIVISYRELDNPTRSGSIDRGRSPSMLQRVPEDAGTLITFFKKPNIRTDLFGLGALLFDMLTCGDSPEHFYDGIRSRDTELDDVKKIQELYENVSSYRVTNPDDLYLFKSFKLAGGSEYAPIEVVTFILRCMLYKAKSTFYDEYYRKEQSKPMVTTAELRKAPMVAANNALRQLASNNEKRYPEKNILMNNNLEVETLPTSDKLAKILEVLQGLDASRLDTRLKLGIWYYTRLVDLVRETVQDPQKYFAELLPDLIDVGNKDFKMLRATYASHGDFLDDLREDIVFTKISRNIEDPFVPNYLAFLRRRITLQPQTSDKAESEFKYRFQSSSLLGRQVIDGDWVVIKPGEQAHLWQIKKPLGDRMSLEIVGEASTTDTLPVESYEAIYYRNLDPSVYYLNMLAIYLYHIFFVGLGTATRDKPLAMNIAESMYYVGAFKGERMYRLTLDKEDKEDKDGDDSSIKQFQIMRRLARLYLRLTTYDMQGYYYNNPASTGKEPKTDKERMIHITEEVNSIQRMIADYLGVLPAALQELNPDDWKLESTQASDPAGSQPLPAHFEFKSLIAWYLDLPWEPTKPPWSKADDVKEPLSKPDDSQEPWWRRLVGKKP